LWPRVADHWLGAVTPSKRTVPSRRIAERVARALEVYLQLGERRSLVRLRDELAKQGRPASLSTLKRWSFSYGWAAQVEAHSREVVEEMARSSYAHREGQIRRSIESIMAAKDRFRKRALLDPDDPDLTPAERRRALRPTLGDFIRLLRAEREFFSKDERR
jgi:hypothetical protein